MCVYMCIYIYRERGREGERERERERERCKIILRRGGGRSSFPGAEDCTPETANMRLCWKMTLTTHWGFQWKSTGKVTILLGRH